ncbi:hypothetical protein ACDW_45470 (plasmid) [Acidovorax sp. DW039]|uniref:hypothetical protein n=1 Tax=Acidovorax sp. DW039 TaxID=3095606 RepID=UPI00308FB3EA|nr:hypothetical protein ACDW_45470 [Acidovorax sp. DW039]
MGLRYFLSATAPNCEPFLNSLAIDRHKAQLQKSVVRDRAIEVLKADSLGIQSHTLTESRFLSTSTMGDKPSKRFIFADKLDATRTVSISARSMADASKFMASQDLFMTLDESLVIAIKGHVLWPAGIAYDRLSNPEAWKAPWDAIFTALDDLPAAALTFYLQKMRGGSVAVRDIQSIAPSVRSSLAIRSLLTTEERPASYEETVKRISVSGLKDLLKHAGVKARVPTRLLLEAQVLSVMTNDLHKKALQLMSAPKTSLRPPCEMSNDDFAKALNEMRDLIYTMRQWLRATYELEREDELRSLSASH